MAGGIVALAATARRMGPTFDGRLRVRRLDWGDAAREGPFDVVLMADIIYAPTANRAKRPSPSSLSAYAYANKRGVLRVVQVDVLRARRLVAFRLHGKRARRTTRS